ADAHRPKSFALAGVRMSRHFWRCNEKALVTRMYEAGAPLREIAAATGVSADALGRGVPADREPVGGVIGPTHVSGYMPDSGRHEHQDGVTA
ncbi:MAG: hypothetical protein QJR04_28980, partial [Burkholderia multivorans]|nr:hypothetical protein [Burkholderia multivorans]